MVPQRGLEPPRSKEHQHLKLARLPIPPLRRTKNILPHSYKKRYGVWPTRFVVTVQSSTLVSLSAALFEATGIKPSAFWWYA